jgi:hypothetical protein
MDVVDSGRRRSGGDRALAPVCRTSDNDRSQYRSAARTSGARFPVGIAPRSSRLSGDHRTHTAREGVRRSLRRRLGEWLCCAAGRRRNRTCVPAFSDSVSACPEKTGRLVVCSPAELVPVVASVSRLLASVVLVLAPVVSLAAATARFLGVTARSPGALHATSPEAKLPSASTHAESRWDQRLWSLPYALLQLTVAKCA